MQPIIILPGIAVSSSTYLDYKYYRSKQAKPYDEPTKFIRRIIRVTKKTGTFYDNMGANVNVYEEEKNYLAAARSFAYNKAYDRFVAKLGSQSSSLGATLTAERRETFGMITDFVMRLLLSARAARRGDYLGVLRALKFDPPVKQVTRTIKRKRGKSRKRITQIYYKMPDRRLVAKSAASSWLLWSYGVSPLLGDIQSSTESFIRGVPVFVKVKSSATESAKTYWHKNDHDEFHHETDIGTVRTRLSSLVTVTNHDLWLLNQLGLVNPIQFLNEAVPFSFVVDWCSNWSSVINSLTDFLGLSLTKSVVSDEYKVSSDYLYIARFRNPVVTSQFQRTFFLYDRNVTTIGPPTLRFRYERFEWRRALNAISLLVGFLPSSKNNRS